MKKIAFLGAKKIGFECLKFLCDHIDLNSYEIVALFTNPNRNVKINNAIIELAQQNNISVYEDLDILKSFPILDYIISVQYHKILKKEHIDCGKLAINLHMAPLPEYRGCNQFSFAIIDGAKIFGTTLHKMNEGIDDGDIIAEKRFSIPENCFVEDLYEMTCENSIALFKENIFDILNDKYTLVPQKQLISQRGTKLIFRKDIDKLKLIDLNWDKAKIEAHIRATLMPGFPPPYAIIGNEKIYFVSNIPV